ncbi:MAG: hypothetical protein ACXADL_13930 [Candidatus Thorarchaeota archaeon]|jgi:hypothetical protein
MVRKTGLVLAMVLFLLFACASTQAVKLYDGQLINNTGLVVNVAIVEVLGDGPDDKKLISEYMLGVLEEVDIQLPAGHYHFYGSVSKGYFTLCLKLPDQLRYPDKPFQIYFELPKNKMRGA